MDLVPERSTGYSRSLSGRTSDFRASFLLTAPLALWLLTTACGVFALLGFIQPYFALG